MSTATSRARPVLRRGAGEVRPRHGPRGPRRAQHQDQDVLRLRHRSSAPSPTRRSARSASGLPGALPVVNEKAVESAIRIGLALNCEIASWCRFARKNYFYPDMPKNFQTSQYDEPIAFDGYLDVELEDGSTYRVEIERAHMEEDTGKSLHVGGSTGRIHGADYSLVDYNRAGIPLIEIVTKPMTGAGERAPEVAKAYVSTLRDLLRALHVSDVRMEQGSLRCDANVSLRPRAGEGQSQDDVPLGTRTETKNVNSLRSVERAVRYEISRHAAVLDSGAPVTQETRHWHEDTGVTTSGRLKSDADDYRYFPEPDLVPVAPTRETGRGPADDAAGAAGPAPPPAAGRLGLLRPRDARRRQRRRRRAHRGVRGGRRHPRRGPQVVDRRAGPARERRRQGRRRVRGHAPGRRRAGPHGQGRPSQRLHGPSGPRCRHRGRGQPPRGRRRAGPRAGPGRRRAGGRRGQGHRGATPMWPRRSAVARCRRPAR